MHAAGVPVPGDAGGIFSESCARQLAGFTRLVEPLLARMEAILNRQFKGAPRAGKRDPRQSKALSLITSGAAVRLLNAGRPLADFYEQVAYNSRRLAKLNVAPAEVVGALAAYDREVDRLLARHGARQAAALQAIRQELHLRTLMAVNEAYYQVREAETQAFYGLVRAEMEAVGLDDLLRRFILILTRTFRAQSGRLIPFAEQPHLSAQKLKSLARPRYITGGTGDEKLILDARMRGVHRSYWSIPFFSGERLAGLIQFGFPTPYRWLPRELDLLDGFAERCLRAAERARLIEELAAREAQVRALAGHLLQAEDEERTRISRELHDEAGQSLLFLRLQLEMLERGAPADIRPRLAEARAVAERIIAEIRRIIAALGPSAVAELGLEAAIRHLSSRFRKLHSVKLRLRLGGGEPPAPGAVANTVYRVVQECYQNIAKHSTASHVNLSLRSTDKQLELSVEDDGVGFEVDQAVARPGSYGLKGMRERIALLGGDFQIRSSPGNGATISIRLPVSPS